MSCPPTVIEPARIQFIEQTFRDLLGPRFDSTIDRGRLQLIRWVHQRLFLEGAPLETVRLELNRRLRTTQLLAVTSGKGGVGKTTVSVNLAVACARQGKRVLLFDADLGMANVHVFAGVNPRHTILDVIDGRTSLDEIRVPGPAGVELICGASGIGRLSDLNPTALEQLGTELLRVAAGFDVLIMDTGAGIAASVTQFLRLAHEAIVVTTPNIAATLDAYGVIKLAHESQIPARLHLLVNQAADEAEAERVSTRIGDCAERFLQCSIGNLGFLVRDAEVERANQTRLPLTLTQPSHLNAVRLFAIATALTAAPDPAHTAAA
jgi:flagellar biosynthesis protein FlhG